MLLPHARHLLVRDGTSGKDPLVDAVLTKQEDGSESLACSHYECAKLLWLSPVKRNYLDACLIASGDLAEIARILDIPVTIVTAYRTFFFNVEGMNRLSKLELIEEYDQAGKDLLIWAMGSGLPFISWRLGEPITINPIQGLQDLFSLSAFKAKEAMYSSADSASSTEAVKWAATSMSLAKLLKAYLMDTNAARSDIEMALGTIEVKFNSFADLNQEPNP